MPPRRNRALCYNAAHWPIVVLGECATLFVSVVSAASTIENAIDVRGLAWPLAVVVALLVLVVPGAAGLALFDLAFNRRRAAWGESLVAAEWLFVTVVLSVMTALWFGLLLAQFGAFSIGALLAVLAVYSAGALGLYTLRRGSPLSALARLNTPREMWLQNALLGLLLIIAAALFFRPAETMLGVQDSGIYYMAGASIERTGGFFITDPLVREIAQFDASRIVPQTGKPKEGAVTNTLLAAPDRNYDRNTYYKRLRQSGFFIQQPLPISVIGLDTTRKAGEKLEAAALNESKVVPQFMPLSQVGIATMIGLFGLYGGFYFPALVALLGVWALYLFVRRTLGSTIAFAATLFCILNSIQIWFARETLWETTGEFLIFAALWGFALLMQVQEKQTRYLGALVSGLAFGMIGLAHVQAPLYWLPLFVWLFYARLTRRLSRADGVFWLAFGLMFTHALIHIAVFALGYTEGIYHNVIIDTVKRAPLYVPLAVAAFVIFVVLDRFPTRIRAAEAWLLRPRVYGRVLWAVALLVLGYLLYGYIVRPGLFSPSTIISTVQHPARLTEYIGAPIERIASAVQAAEAGTIKSNAVSAVVAQTNLVRLGWYFLPLGMLLAFVGVAAMLRRNLTPALGLFITIALAASIFFVDQSYTTPNFIYSARRFVPITVPAFSVFIAYALFSWLPATWIWLSRRLPASVGGSSRGDIRRNVGAWVGLFLAVVMVAFFVVTGRTIIAHGEYAGALADVRVVAAQLDPTDIAVFCCTRDEDGKIAAPLTYIFGRQSFTINGDRPNNTSLAALFAQWEREGHHVKLILGTNGGKFAPDGFDVVAQQDENITVRQFEQLAAQKPYNVINPPIILSYGLYDLRPHTTNPTAPGFGTGAPQAPDGWRLQIGALDYAALGGGFYNRETDTSGTVFRWTGSDPGQLRLPCLPAGRGGEVALTLSGYRPPNLNAKPVPVTLWLSDNVYTTFDKAQTTFGNTIIGNLTLGNDPQTYTVTIPPNAPVLAGCTSGRDSTFILNLTVPKDALWSPADAHISNDQRKLGIKVSAIGLKAK